MYGDVYNRSLFRNKSREARDKLRELGGVGEPSGILASSPELLQAAAPVPAPQPAPMPQVHHMSNAAVPYGSGVDDFIRSRSVARYADGGDISARGGFWAGVGSGLEGLGDAIERKADRSSEIPQYTLDAGDTTGNPRWDRAFNLPIDITEDPADFKSEMEERTRRELERAALAVDAAVEDPDLSESAKQEIYTYHFGEDNTKDGLINVVEKVTGEPVDPSATVDELNNAIAGVALGGAIGGPRSAAERISAALMQGLIAKRETAMAREASSAEMEIAKISAAAKGAVDTTKLDAEFQADIEDIMNKRYESYMTQDDINQMRQDVAMEIAAQRLQAGMYVPQGIKDSMAMAAAVSAASTQTNRQLFMATLMENPDAETFTDSSGRSIPITDDARAQALADIEASKNQE